LARRNMSHHCGRQMGLDRSWTVYHVFSGVPAELEGWSMTGLGRSRTATMISLNARNAKRRHACRSWRLAGEIV
jgi:hypothetical protein